VIVYFAGKMSNFISKAKSVIGSLSFSSTRSRTSSWAGSSYAGSEMDVDPPSPTIRSSSRQAQEVIFTLLRDNQIKFEDDREKEIYKKLKDRKFTHTPAFDLDLLQSIGMDSELDIIFRNVGWEDAWGINELGCRLLTIEFLCTLQSREHEVSFRLFNKEFSPSWKHFSRFLV
jgi:hypothetical protein